MDHYPDPYDDEHEVRSRESSWKALAVLILLTLASTIGLIGYKLVRWIAGLIP